MKSKFIFYFFILCFPFRSIGQHVEWMRRIGGNAIDIGSDIAFDKDGNVYAAGSFSDTANFAPNAPDSLISNGSIDVFLSKYDSLGNLKWKKNFGSIYGFEDLSFIVIDPLSKFLYMTCYFWDTLHLNTGSGNFDLISAGRSDVLILKLDLNGNYIWAKHLGGIGFDEPRDVETDPQGNLYVSGNFTDVCDFDPGINQFNVAPVTIQDGFICKLDSGGNLIWVRTFQCNPIGKIALGQTGNLYLTGQYLDTVDVDPGPGVYDLKGIGPSNGFVLALDSSGSFIWAKSFFGANSRTLGLSIDVDAMGNVYCSGVFDHTSDFDPGPLVQNFSSAGSNDFYVVKLDSIGNLIWAEKYGSVAAESAWTILVHNNNVIVTGEFEYTVDFDPSPSVFSLTAFWDAYFLVLDTAGSFISVHQLGSGSAIAQGYSIATDNFGNLYWMGSFSDVCSYDHNSSLSMTCQGSGDAFVIKLSGLDLILGQPELEKKQATVYPNPTTGNFVIQLGKTERKADVTVYDILGRSIFNKSYVDVSQIEMNLVNVPGIYFVSVRTDKEQFETKVVLK